MKLEYLKARAAEKSTWTGAAQVLAGAGILFKAEEVAAAAEAVGQGAEVIGQGGTVGMALSVMVFGLVQMLFAERGRR